jgi:nitrous oxide reductase accessory protein NosL
MRAIFFFITLLSITFADELSSAKVTKLVKKGEQIANTLCNKKELLSLKSKALAPNKIAEKLQQAKSCGGLSSRNYKALSYFLFSKKEESNISKITVPHDAKCPVCGMFVYKYPKWSAVIKLNGKEYYFDGIKDMIKYYIFSVDFPYDRNKIESITVSDYYTLEAIDAKNAFYVVGSDVLGPMGNELIAFKDKKSANNFMRDHRGKNILEFNDINAKVIISLQ